MNTTHLRLRYTQFLVIFLLGIFLYVMGQSLADGVSLFETNLWNRQFLITSFTRLRLKLGNQVFPQVLVGKQGWLELATYVNLNDYQNTTGISEKTLQRTQQNLQKLYNQLRKRNITLLLVIPPNKATIYPDKLSDQIQKIGPQSNLDKFAAYIEQHGPPVFVDLRPALQEARKKYQIYYKTDTHWNPYGGFFAYREIMKKLSQNYPSLTPKGIDDFKITSLDPSAHDLVMVMGAPNWLEASIEFTPKETDTIRWVTLNNTIGLDTSVTSKPNLPALLMYKDSFGGALKPFLAPHFSRATFVAYRPEDSAYTNVTSLTTIDAVKPDIVIIEIVERLFGSQYLDDVLQKLLMEE